MLFFQTVRLKSALDGRSDAELLRLTHRRDDRDAFGVFYRRHQQAVLAFVVRQTGDLDLAQDVVADSFAVAFSKVALFDPDRGTGRQWLFGIARVAMLVHFRKGGVEQSARDRLGVVTEEVRPIEAVEARIDSSVSAVVAGLGELSEPERQAVVARVIEDREYSEIARRQSSSEDVVRQRVSRGLRKLAKFTGRGLR